MRTRKRPNRIIIALIVIALIAAGFIRDFIFVRINWQLGYLNSIGNEDSRFPLQEFLSSFSYDQLYIGKWILTGIFTILYFVMTCVLVHLIFNNRTHLRITLYSYGLLLLTAVISYGLGWALGEVQKGYEFARIFMHLSQSPVIVMVLIPALMLVAYQPGKN